MYLYSYLYSHLHSYLYSYLSFKNYSLHLCASLHFSHLRITLLRYTEVGSTKARVSRAAARTPTYMGHYDVIRITGNMVLVTSVSTSERIPPKIIRNLGTRPKIYPPVLS